MNFKILLSILFFSTFCKGFSQPDSFSTIVNDPVLGELNIVLYKYSTRGSNYQIFLYDGNNLTPYSVPELRTYRGYIENKENSKITAVWYPDNKLYIRLLSGKGDQYDYDIKDIDISNLNITELNLPISLTPQKSERHLTSGYTTNYQWLSAVADGDIEKAITIIENGVNQFDLSIARDIGTSISTNLMVIPTTYVPDFNPRNSNYPGLNETNAWWRCYGSGGGAGFQNYCIKPYRGGRTSLQITGFKAMPHEFGHTLNLGHYHNQYDAMHSNQFYLGRDNAVRALEHLTSINNTCLEVSNSNYTDPLRPYTPEDYVITYSNTPVLIDVLANDVDYNGDVISLHDYDITSYYGGVIEQIGDKLKYTPPLDFHGKDVFYYKAKSGNVQDNTFFWNLGRVSVDVRGAEDLLLYYPFEETKGTTAFNQTNNATQYNGTIIRGVLDNMSNSNGIVGNCINLEEGQLIAMNDLLDPLSESITISVWFSLNEIPDSNRRMIFDSGSKGKLTHSGLSMSIQGNKLNFLAQHEGTDNSGADRYAVVNWQTNKWYHAVMVVDRNTNKLYGYLDGVEVGNSSRRQDLKPEGIIKGYPGLKGRIATAIGSNCRTDRFSVGEQDKFFGRIDELKIYGKALNELEIKDEFEFPQGYYNGCQIGLFQEPIRNSSFEKNIIKSEKAQLVFDWYASNKRKGFVTWSGYSNTTPNAPDGKNWGRIDGKSGIYQQIGIWEPNQDYTISFTYGKHATFNNTDLEVSLWVGGNDYAERERHLNDIGATKIDYVLISSSVLNSSSQQEQLISLSTNSESYGCVPLWIMFENKNAANKSVNLLDAIQIVKNDDLLIESVSIDKKIIVYPNPTSGKLNIKSDSLIQGIELIDISGRQILSQQKDFHEETIDVSQLLSGVYFLNIKVEGKTVTKKIIKQ